MLVRPRAPVVAEPASPLHDEFEAARQASLAAEAERRQGPSEARRLAPHPANAPATTGGAPVAPPLLADAREKLPHLTAKRVYGSSEFPTISTTDATDATERGHDSEGKPLRGIALQARVAR